MKRRQIRSRRSTPGPAHRAKLDDNAELAKFCATLEKVTVATVETGFMTKDLALLVGPEQKWLTTEGFLDKVDENLRNAMGKDWRATKSKSKAYCSQVEEIMLSSTRLLNIQMVLDFTIRSISRAPHLRA